MFCARLYSYSRLRKSESVIALGFLISSSAVPNWGGGCGGGGGVSVFHLGYLSQTVFKRLAVGLGRGESQCMQMLTLGDRSRRGRSGNDAPGNVRVNDLTSE